ncbi:putative DNA repair and recombination protein RAD54B [Rhizopus microsporus ATCC 52813]|uniref:DNA helicase n=1 Tax=Rhizopus microsporus ATCC 52813 TaxID=1340429 RepID=A0A2G4SVT3_RHIZD|nr:putative DNA repair and recombination protein RAD54B [Rhizopus microsporus ATCC 52813]PHZ12877.1 putative DNA repair and recombination protein RAD54B [Rhizopus microsporus ATCC 52813]
MRGRDILKKSNREAEMLKFFNTATSQDIQELTGCKPHTADKLIQELRPFENVDDLSNKLKKERGMSVKYINTYLEINEGYDAVDEIIKEIEQTGSQLQSILNIWKEMSSENNSEEEEENDNEGEEDEKAGLHLQPEIISKEIQLKDYQLLGINWMLLLYRKNISGILADEMGLGKTAQVISFLGRLYELGDQGPHLIIVPASTIENWSREFKKFCPSLNVRMYHGTQPERMDQRYELEEDEYEVILTTYNTATGSVEDRSFLRNIKFKSVILDEGHMIKNCTSARYKYLMKIKSQFKLLLTGTPLQNNLQELVSLLTFIMPNTFKNYEEEIRSIFKIKTNESLLQKKRIIRAKQMMTPFLLRRKKKDVLKDLPQKIEIIEECEMTKQQQDVYNSILENRTQERMENIIIHLRKAADHPLLFRYLYTDDVLRKMTKDIMKDVKYWDSNEEYVYEDMTVMSDYELNELCKENRTIKKYQLSNEEWMNSGKITKLKEILQDKIKNKEKILIFSQFTRMLNILELVMQTLDIKYRRLDGETKVMERQEVIDEFNQDESIPVFLLSTKAGGFGINLTSANIVILYDLDFNPQNDKQAEDRAHRVGQTKDVTVIKLICKNSIEEYILKMADIKLRLDKTISSDELLLQQHLLLTNNNNNNNNNTRNK